MKNLIPFSILFVVLFCFQGCGSAENGERTADVFLKLLVNEKYKEAATLLEVNVVDSVIYEQVLKGFVHDNKYGKLKSFEKKTGFNTQIRNGVTSVELPYDLKYERGTYKRTITLVDRGAGFKIQSIL